MTGRVYDILTDMDAILQARLIEQVRRLRLSQSDMEQVRFAAEAIPAHQGPMRRLLETALAVTYARPFAQGLSMNRKKWGPEDVGERAIHARLIDLRNQLYAHTDDSPHRGVVDTAVMLGRGEHSYAEQWTEMRDDEMPLVAAMAAGQRERFKAKADELQGRLQAASTKQPSPVPLYHRAADPEVILASGFQDTTTESVGGQTVSGVWFADEPHREMLPEDGALLYLQIPEARIADCECVEYGRPYREWLIPAALANEFGPPVLVRTG